MSAIVVRMNPACEASSALWRPMAWRLMSVVEMSIAASIRPPSNQPPLKSDSSKKEGMSPDISSRNARRAATASISTPSQSLQGTTTARTDAPSAERPKVARNRAMSSISSVRFKAMKIPASMVMNRTMPYHQTQIVVSLR